jgi:uncharacterized protein YrrD
MTQIPFWLDTDTGVDDAFALLAAGRNRHASTACWLRCHALFAGCRCCLGNIPPADEQEGCAMLTTLNRLTGMPVVYGGEKIGLVERAVPDRAAERLWGLVVRNGLRAAGWIPAGGVEWMGERCIAIGQQPKPLPTGLSEPVRHVCLTDGRLVGQVADHILRSDTYRIVALEVSPGPLYRLLGKNSYAREYRFEKERVLVPQLLSWAQLNRLLEEE